MKISIYFSLFIFFSTSLLAVKILKLRIAYCSSSNCPGKYCVLEKEMGSYWLG